MSNNFISKIKKLIRVKEQFLPKAAVIAVNFSKERFVQKNWVDRNREPWQDRKREARGSLLVKTGRLKRSIRKIKVGSNYIVIGSDVPYAQIHNQGGTIKKTVRVKAHNRKNTRGREKGVSEVKEHSRRMNITFKKRQFLGESDILLRRIERNLEKDIREALK